MLLLLAQDLVMYATAEIDRHEQAFAQAAQKFFEMPGSYVHRQAG